VDESDNEGTSIPLVDRTDDDEGHAGEEGHSIGLDFL
jgi:hypothetical protein